jgi:hypothetical protein
MPDSLRIFPAKSPQWDAWMHGTLHDFHHTAAHHLVWQENGCGQGLLAVYGSADRFVAWPYLLRPIEAVHYGDTNGMEGCYDITSVDGYSGPLLVGCGPGDPFIRTALQSIFEGWRESRVVSVFTRFHPLLMNQICFHEPGEPHAQCPDLPGLRHEGHTVSIDLRLSDEEARAEYRESHLRHIRRAIRQGLTTGIDNSSTAFEEFVRLYHQTMRRNNAAPHYFFSKDFLERLREALAPGVSIHLARMDGRTVAAVFITEFCGIVQYLLGGVDDAVYHLSPLKPLLDGVRQWARERGNHTLHLGGGRRCQDDDPLFYFKAGFSSRRHCFYTGRWILDRERYDGLVALRNQQFPTDYFPAYRTPLADEWGVVHSMPVELQRLKRTKEEETCAHSRSPVQS